MPHRPGIRSLISPAIIAGAMFAGTPAAKAGNEQFGLIQHDSVARQWNEMLLESIRKDQARPVVHARNLFHVSAAMWDAWAMFDPDATPWLHVETAPKVRDVETFRNRVIAHAAYGLVRHRFTTSPGFSTMAAHYDQLMVQLGCDPSDLSTAGKTAAAIGNRIAASYVLFGLSDGANEIGDYANQWYVPLNDPLLPPLSGTQSIAVPDRWQPLALDYYVDQSGHVGVNGYPEFLGPEWGQVTPFGLTDDHRTDYQRDGYDYPVYVDPGAPPRLDAAARNSSSTYLTPSRAQRAATPVTRRRSAATSDVERPPSPVTSRGCGVAAASSSHAPPPPSPPVPPAPPPPRSLPRLRAISLAAMGRSATGWSE